SPAPASKSSPSSLVTACQKPEPRARYSHATPVWPAVAADRLPNRTNSTRAVRPAHSDGLEQCEVLTARRDYDDFRWVQSVRDRTHLKSRSFPGRPSRGVTWKAPSHAWLACPCPRSVT